MKIDLFTTKDSECNCLDKKSSPKQINSDKDYHQFYRDVQSKAHQIELNEFSTTIQNVIDSIECTIKRLDNQENNISSYQNEIKLIGDNGIILESSFEGIKMSIRRKINALKYVREQFIKQIKAMHQIIDGKKIHIFERSFITERDELCQELTKFKKINLHFNQNTITLETENNTNIKSYVLHKCLVEYLEHLKNNIYYKANTSCEQDFIISEIWKFYKSNKEELEYFEINLLRFFRYVYNKGFNWDGEENYLALKNWND